MKALLLKDLYMMRKYCRTFLLILVVFIGVSFFNEQGTFFRTYPCLIAGMIPMTLLAYDERSKWDRYSLGLPYRRDLIVTEKYLLGLLLILCMVLLSAAVGLLQRRAGGSAPEQISAEFTLLLVVALLAPSIAMPVYFKLGTERGRIANYIMIGVICGGGVLAASALDAGAAAAFLAAQPLPLFAVAALAVYALSWQLSCRFYEKREF